MTPCQAAVKICEMILEFIAYMIMLMAWIAGIALSTGFLERIAVAIVFPYAWVVTAEAILRAMGLMP